MSRSHLVHTSNPPAREEKGSSDPATSLQLSWSALAFEENNYKDEDFVTEHGTRGGYRPRFSGSAARRVFSGRDAPPYIAPAAMQEDLELLTSLFCAIGTLSGRIPLPTEVTDVGRVVSQLITILRPSIEQAEQVLRWLTASFIQSMGGSAEKYLMAPFGTLTVQRWRA